MHYQQSLGPTQLKKNLHEVSRYDANPSPTYRSLDNDSPEQDILGGVGTGTSSIKLFPLKLSLKVQENRNLPFQF